MDKIKRWDWAWKEFLDPETPWGPYFITKILGKEYADYAIEMSDMHNSSSSTNTEFRETGRLQVADALISFRINNVEKRLHIELQSTNCSDICKRMLMYELQSSNVSGDLQDIEEYQLPYGVIVNVRPYSPKQKGKIRTLRLHINKQIISVKYPVIEAYLKVPEIYDIMTSKNEYSLLDSIRLLRNNLPDFSESSILMDRFYRSCFLISNPKVFENGVKEVEVEAVMESWGNKLTFGEELKIAEEVGIQKGIQRGIQKGIKQAEEKADKEKEEAIARAVTAFGITREKAAQILFGKCNGVSYVSKYTRDSGLKEMEFE